MQIIETLFSCVMKMACTAVFIIPVVFAARVILGKVSKRICFLLWGIVALRLLCPVMLPSGIAVSAYIPRSGQFAQIRQMAQDTEQPPVNVQSGSVFAADTGGEPRFAPAGRIWEPVSSDMPQQLRWYHIIWLVGAISMLSYAVVSSYVIHRKLRFATRREGNVYESDVVDSPFVYGFIHPAVYLPYHLNERERAYILRHENYHIRRKDHLTRWLAYLLLCIYWFHPLVWISYVLFLCDMEMSCDEYVLRNSGALERKEYGTVLLNFTAERRIIMNGIGFGEGNIRKRMQHILSYKKKTLWSTAAAMAFLAVVAVACLTDEVAAEKNGGRAQEADVSEAAAALYEAANPYIGDASANGRLLNVINEYFGGLEQAYTTELSTDKEPYALTLHFEEAPADEHKLWHSAVLFLALTENCGEVRWDYDSAETGNGKANTYILIDHSDENLEFNILEDTADGTALTTYYVTREDANMNLDVADIKEYADSPESVEELIGMLDGELYVTKRLPDDTYPDSTEILSTKLSTDMYIQLDGAGGDIYVRELE